MKEVEVSWSGAGKDIDEKRKMRDRCDPFTMKSVSTY